MKTLDKKNRSLKDIRISVTDKCNFRCGYCMPKDIYNSSYQFLKKAEILSFEEIELLVNSFSDLGVEKVRLTGGEPLLRKNIHKLVERIKVNNKIKDVCITTNGVLMTKEAVNNLKLSGLDRITFSLDSINESSFKKISDTNYTPSDVIQGIENALSAGFKNTKINVVIKKGINDNEIVDILSYFKNHDIEIRFIEFMDVGNTNDWSFEKVFGRDQILNEIEKKYTINKVKDLAQSSTSEVWSYDYGRFGIISSVTKPFCINCTRIRLTCDGKLYNCLFSSNGYDIMKFIRPFYMDDKLINFLSNLWKSRDDSYSLDRKKIITVNKVKDKAEMSYIGG
jgi:cyclic pyranopterin phosphate synthase|tara:strand:+ start:1359 stop:2372 length:1014 start_codon:yes stop_codon:yes gene_type:complete